MKSLPKKPGAYVDYTNREGRVRYAPLTRAMAARRNAIAKALGYVLPEKCTINSIHGDNGRRFECWERGEFTFKSGKKAAAYHQVFVDDLSGRGAPEGTIAYRWPDDVEAAAYAIDKRKPLPGEADEAADGALTAGVV